MPAPPRFRLLEGSAKLKLDAVEVKLILWTNVFDENVTDV